MRLNTNVSALNTLRNLNRTQQMEADSTAKLSSGFRINKASDDAAGLAIADRLRNTGAALTTASQNADQASSMLQIADGAAQVISSIVDRMKQLATQAASANAGTGAYDQHPKLDAEFQALNSEIGRIVGSTSYQGVSLLSGGGTAGTNVVSANTFTAAMDVASTSVQTGVVNGVYTVTSAAGSNGVVTLTDGAGHSQSLIAVNGAQTLNFSQIGITISTGIGFAASTAGAAASFNTGTLTVSTGVAATAGMNFLIGASGDPSGNDKLTVNLGSIAPLSSGDLLTASDATTAMASVDTLLNTVTSFLGTLGASESRISFAQQNLASTIQNTAAAESTIRDVDMAAEMTNFTKSQILATAATAMLAQANTSGQSVLKLFQ